MNLIVQTNYANLTVNSYANITVNVSPTGSDVAGDGSAANPWATLQFAFDTIKTWAMAYTSTVTVQMADGTYTQNATLDRPVGGVVIVNGDSTTPTNVVFNGTITAQSGANIMVRNMSLQGLYSKWGSWMVIDVGITFSAFSGGDHIQVGNGGNVYVQANYTISGSAARHLSMGDFGAIDYLNSLTVTLTGTPAFTEFASLYGLCFVRFHSWGTRVTWSGAATGTRYSASTGAVIDTSGGGANYLPGNVAGSTSNGGQYY